MPVTGGGGGNKIVPVKAAASGVAYVAPPFRAALGFDFAMRAARLRRWV
jgi:hypothetical protein